MSFLNICGFETGDMSEALTTSGSVSIQSSVMRSGTYALRCNGTGAFRLGAARTTGTVNMAASVSYSRIYFRYDTKPAANDEPFAMVADSAPNIKLELRLTSTGVIKVYDNTGTNLVGTGATVLSSGTFYRIEFKCSTGNPSAWEVLVNGAVEVSGSSNLGGNPTAQIYLGKWVNRNGGSVDFFYDDVCVSDSAYPGDGKSLLFLPSGDGSFTTWTIGAGAGSKYEQVDELPPDGDTSYLISTQVLLDAYTAAMQDCATVGLSGTINCVKGIYLVKGAGGFINTRIRGGGTNSDSANISINTVGAYVGIERLLALDPSTSAAWTTGGIDGAEVGVVEASTSVPTRVSAIFLLVDFVPTSPTSPAGSVGFSGSLHSSVGLPRSGSLSESGSLSAIKAALLAPAGGVTPAGVLANAISARYAGATVPVGSLRARIKII
jgi:hypothetical protein